MRAGSSPLEQFISGVGREVYLAGQWTQIAAVAGLAVHHSDRNYQTESALLIRQALARIEETLATSRG